MTDVQSTSSGATSQGLLGRDTDSSGLNSQNSTVLNSQSRTNELQISHDTTTEEKLKSSQSPLDHFLSETSELALSAADTVSDLATDAYQGLREINQEYALDQRALGALKMAGGLGEAFVGGVGIMAPEPLTTVGGSAIFVHGVDVFQSGLQEVTTGKPIETVTDQVATESAKLLGADGPTAEQIGDSVDMGLSLASTGVGVYQAMTRPVVAELGPMTIKSSPKTDPSSEFSAGGKTQAGNGNALKPEVTNPASMQPARVSDDIAGNAEKTGKLQIAEGLGKATSPETAITTRVGSIAPNSQLTKQEALQRMQEALRYRQLSWNHEQKKFSIIEAHGVSRAEQALGRRFEPSNIEGVDFLDPTGLGRVSLKGPFLDKNLQPLKLEYQQKAAENILKHVEANKAVDIHIIDTKGLNDEVFKAMQETLKNSQTNIQYLR
jgi:hypothetical protein